MGTATFRDEFFAAGTGKSGVRFLNLARDVPFADLVNPGGQSIETDLVYGKAGSYKVVASGLIDFESRPSGSTAFTSLTERAAPGDFYSAVLVGGLEEPVTLRWFTDASGLSVIPEGPVQTGGGDRLDHPRYARTALLFLGVALSALLANRRRRSVVTSIISTSLLILAGCATEVPTASSTPAKSSATAEPASLIVLGSKIAATSSVTPTEISFPSLNESGPVTPLDVAKPELGGELQRLTSARSVGWFKKSAVPGEPGLAIMVGHINYDGIAGVFSQLARLKLGSTVSVRRSDGRSISFRVNGARVFQKDSFPTEIVYAPSPVGVAELRLISCTGPVVEGHYRDNIIVYAYQTSEPS